MAMNTLLQPSTIKVSVTQFIASQFTRVGGIPFQTQNYSPRNVGVDMSEWRQIRWKALNHRAALRHLKPRQLEADLLNLTLEWNVLNGGEKRMVSQEMEDSSLYSLLGWNVVHARDMDVAGLNRGGNAILSDWFHEGLVDYVYSHNLIHLLRGATIGMHLQQRGSSIILYSLNHIEQLMGLDRVALCFLETLRDNRGFGQNIALGLVKGGYHHQILNHCKVRNVPTQEFLRDFVQRVNSELRENSNGLFVKRHASQMQSFSLKTFMNLYRGDDELPWITCHEDAIQYTNPAKLNFSEARYRIRVLGFDKENIQKLNQNLARAALYHLIYSSFSSVDEKQILIESIRGKRTSDGVATWLVSWSKDAVDKVAEMLGSGDFGDFQLQEERLPKVVIEHFSDNLLPAEPVKRSKNAL
jgi:hypothetical protein